MTPERRAEVKARILAAVEKARAAGVRIADSDFGVRRTGLGFPWHVENGECCPLGAVLLDTRESAGFGVLNAAACALGITDSEARDFYDGFDDNECSSGPWYDLGRELREELLVPAARGREVTS